ncbi:MarR family winged helix-turn-helix transcriptional regulator [Amycolatopsis nigrescens]|uniref:MarR family winged helix-turn-helix transcriptional regulator n=1 Tax=Amycolatopsis nigrescens TaxID=381445 RepID=UPI0003730A93|nr:MarR family transcriptional regulator [Amycolatopsis nigrescens]
MSLQFSESDSPGFLTNLTAMAINTGNDKALAPYGVTGAQWTVLWLLSERKADTPKTIAAYLNIDTGATSRLLARLQHKGLIETVPNPDDRRSVIVHRTARAAKLYPKLREAIAASVEHAFTGISRTELTAFKRILLHVLENQTAPRR